MRPNLFLRNTPSILISAVTVGLLGWVHPCDDRRVRRLWKNRQRGLEVMDELRTEGVINDALFPERGRIFSTLSMSQCKRVTSMLRNLLLPITAYDNDTIEEEGDTLTLFDCSFFSLLHKTTSDLSCFFSCHFVLWERWKRHINKEAWVFFSVRTKHTCRGRRNYHYLPKRRGNKCFLTWDEIELTVLGSLSQCFLVTVSIRQRVPSLQREEMNKSWTNEGCFSLQRSSFLLPQTLTIHWEINGISTEPILTISARMDDSVLTLRLSLSSVHDCRRVWFGLVEKGLMSDEGLIFFESTTTPSRRIIPSSIYSTLE